MPPTAADFGFSTTTSYGTPARGIRPLLTILMKFSDVPFEAKHTPDYYRQLLFATNGTGPIASVAGGGGFFDQNSQGQFWFADAGVLGPFTNPNDPTTAGNESLRRDAVERNTGPEAEHAWATILGNAIRCADLAGFDFKQFDRNGDGRITNDELVIIVIVANTKGDNFTTTDPRWSGKPGDNKEPFSGYRFVRRNGYVSSPDLPRPPGQIPLYSWYSALRNDNYLTTRPNWAGKPGDTREPDYQFVRLEGYIFPPDALSGLGMTALCSWWSPSRGDNFTTTDTAWIGNTGDTRAPDYRFVRREGYIHSEGFAQPPGTVPLHSWYADRFDPLGGTRATHPACIPVKGGVEACPAVVSVFETISAATLAHELSHAVGFGQELYGSSSLNRNFGIMGTVDPVLLDGRNIVHHDPLAKCKFGWLTPTILSTTESRTIHLRATELPPDPAEPQMCVVYNPAHGTNEFFILEHRFRGAGAPHGKVGLSSWWSPSRNDNFTTSYHSWQGRRGEKQAPDYRFVRFEGYIDAPELGPVGGKIALYQWWNSTRGDHFLTSDPSWIGKVGDIRGGYECLGIAGYVNPPTSGPTVGKVALYSWWSETREDNFVTSDPRWSGKIGDTRAPDYRFVRIEGYADLGVQLNYDADPWATGRSRDESLPDEGLAIWRVTLNAAKDVVQIPSLTKKINPDVAFLLISPSGPAGFPADGNGCWDASDGVAQPTWLDQTESGLSVRVETPSVRVPVIQVRLGP